MKTIPLYTTVNPGCEHSPLTLATAAALGLRALLADGSWTLLINSYGAVVVARPDVHDALLGDELVEGRKYLVSHAALQAEACAKDAATSAPFTDTYFARIDVGCFAGRPPRYRFTLNVGPPPAGEDYAIYAPFLVVDAEPQREGAA